jgi:hypothetical protein
MAPSTLLVVTPYKIKLEMTPKYIISIHNIVIKKFVRLTIIPNNPTKKTRKVNVSQFVKSESDEFKALKAPSGSEKIIVCIFLDICSWRHGENRIVIF